MRERGENKERRVDGLKHRVSVKITAFVLMAVLVVVFIGSIGGAIAMWKAGIYRQSQEAFEEEIYNGLTYDTGYELTRQYLAGNLEYIEWICANNANVEFEIQDGLSSYKSNGLETGTNMTAYVQTYPLGNYYTPYDLESEGSTYAISEDAMKGTELTTVIAQVQWAIAEQESGVTESVDSSILEAFTDYEITTVVYVEEDMTMIDDYFWMDKFIEIAYTLQGVIVLIALASIAGAIGLFIFLVKAAGYRKGHEERIVCGTARIPYEIYLFIVSGVGLSFLAIAMDGYYMIYNSSISYAIYVMGFLVMSGLVGIQFLLDLIVRYDTGTLRSNCLVVRLWKRFQISNVIRRTVKWIIVHIGKVTSAIPLLWKGIIVYACVTIWPLMMVGFYNYGTRMTIWILGNCIAAPVFLYLYYMFRKIQIASKKLENGEFSYKINSKLFIFEFKEMAESLNSMAAGMKIALEEQMKSERMKTELISNVSHDIKTPLTSIVNYADLISKEETENEKIHEYSAILLRQSDRLKKLTEDLVHASKVTSGNVEVKLAPCDIKVLLEQAVGEYEQKLLDAKLKVVIGESSEEVIILADGRHLWRVFDNLLNNICKYAQDGTRVYLSVKQLESHAVVEFKNISKYELNISERELMERFVRGDKSRHSDGNGLGLSIAKSLVELQGGTMNLMIDGDLFKVVLTF